MGNGRAVNEESACEAAEERLRVPPVRERGRENENPPELSFWQLLGEDVERHEQNPFEQGFRAVANGRFGNWRMGLKNPVLRAPCALAHDALEKGIELGKSTPSGEIIETPRNVTVRDVYARHGFQAGNGRREPVKVERRWPA